MVPIFRTFHRLVLVMDPYHILRVPGCGSLYMFSSPSVPEYGQPSKRRHSRKNDQSHDRQGAETRTARDRWTACKWCFKPGILRRCYAGALVRTAGYIHHSGGDATVKSADMAGGQEVRTLTGYGMLGAE